MWALRVLTGKNAGKIIELSQGKHTIGRGANCQVTLASQGVSKQHAQIEVFADKVILTDMGSSNGTFVNGVQIKAQKINTGDKISFHDVLVELGPLSNFKQNNYDPHQGQQGFYQTNGHAPIFDGNAALQQQGNYDPNMQPQPQASGGPSAAPQHAEGVLGKVQEYLDEVVLPGIYKLPEWFEFKFVYASFIIAFVVAVTGLSAIPLVRILKSSVETESRDHSITIAKFMAQSNQQAVAQGVEASLDVDRFRKGGVTEVYIVGRDGIIMAPSRDAGRAPDQSIVQRFRQAEQAMVDNIDDETVVAVAPVYVRNSQTGLSQIGAYSVVVYDMGSLAVNDEKVVSLLVQTLFIALILGSLWFFVTFKMVEFPFVRLNQQLDKALQGKVHQVESEYQLEPLAKLTSYINSALSRMSDDSFGDGPMGGQVEADRSSEMRNLVELVGFPALAINAADQVIESVNPVFSMKTGINGDSLMHSPIANMTDQAFKLNVLDLIEQVQNNPQDLAVGTIEFSGVPHEILAQGISGSSGIAFFLIVLIPQEDGGAVG